MFKEDRIASEYIVSLRSARRRRDMRETDVWECLGDQAFAFWAMVDKYTTKFLGVDIAGKEGSREINRKKADEAVAHARGRWGHQTGVMLEVSLVKFIGTHTPRGAKSLAARIAQGTIDNLGC